MTATRADLEALAVRCEKAIGPNREIDRAIARAIDQSENYSFTSSLGQARSIDNQNGTLVFASEIGADGLPIVKLVRDTSTWPIVEYVGIAVTLQLAWCAAALRSRGSEL